MKDDKISDVATLINDTWLSPKSECVGDVVPTWLEVRSVDPVPFSQNFSDLFEGLGLQAPSIDTAPAEQEEQRSPLDVSYELNNITDLQDIPDWEHDEVDEIVVIKRRPLTLPTILEDKIDGNISCVPTTKMSDFDFEDANSISISAKHQRIIIQRDTKRRYVAKTRKVVDSIWVEHIVLEVVTDLSLPFVTHMRWSCRDMDQIHMITDHYEGGTLEALLDRHGGLGSPKARFYATEIAAGISHLHSSGIVHRHLNPKTIFLEGDGHLVISGFDRADFLNQQGQQGKSPIIDDDMIEYSAPELLSSWSHDGRVDCWSFGMLVYYLFFGKHPYQRDMDDYNLTIRELVISRPISADSLRLIHPTARDLILKCLERNPAFRVDIEGIKQQAYFESTNWCHVSSKGLEAPSFRVMDDDMVSLSDALRRPLSMIPSLDSVSPMATPSSKKGISFRYTGGRALVSDPSVLPELCRPSTPANPPRPILQLAAVEEQTPSEVDTVDDRISVAELDIGKAVAKKKTPSFWDKLDREERGSVSAKSLEFGQTTGVPYGCAPKLRKYRSAIHPRQLLNLSTASFHKRFKKKTQSSGILKRGVSSDVLPELPNGVHQIGSGIGFSYNMPSKSVGSRVSLASFAPGACYTLFHGGFSVRSLSRTLSPPSAPPGRTRGKAKSSHNDAICRPRAAREVKRSEDTCLSDDFVPCEEKIPECRQDVGGGTFIREMYRAPSWILVPPESLPSPMSLVNSPVPLSSVNRASCSDSTHRRNAPCGSSPKTESAPLTPATLVNTDGGPGRMHVMLTSAEDGSEGDREINISLSKEVKLALDLAFPDGTPRSTLRLVPSSGTMNARPSSFNEMAGLRVSCGGPPLPGIPHIGLLDGVSLP